MNLGVERCRNKPSGHCSLFIFNIEPVVQNLVVGSAQHKCRFREFAYTENSSNCKFLMCVCVSVFLCRIGISVCR